MSTSTTSAPVKRACDSCHRRKVKCIGEGTSSCKNCISAGLACTYNAIPQKKGPKGSRAKVLSELRENQRNAHVTTGLPHELAFDPRLTTTFTRTPGLLSLALFESCVDFFFINVYPSQPILHRQRAQELVMSTEHSTEAYCMVAALCAYVMIQTNMTVPAELLPRPEMAQLSNVSVGHVILEEALRVRKGLDYLENPTHTSVLTSWFLYGCHFGLGRDNTAWSFLREATTQAQLIGLHDEETYKSDPLDISRRRVIYWLLYIAERTHALHKHRPISLFPTIHPPTLDEAPADRAIASGLDLMVNLYKPVNDEFVLLWNKVHPHANPTWIAQVQNQLSEALPPYFDCTESQAADLRVTQQWLRTMLWQLCVSQGLVSSVSADITMTFKYPIEISRDLLALTTQFSQQAMEVHGVGLIEKLFDIACCLTDVVACIPFSPDAFGLGPRDLVSRFVTLFSALHGGQTRYLQMLIAKVSEVLPNLPLPRSLSVSQSPPMTMGLAPGTLGTVHPNIGDGLSPISTVALPSYPSTELIRQLAAQTGAQLPFINSQQPILHPPSSRVEDLSLYSSGSHSTRSPGSGPQSQATTPGPYDHAHQPRNLSTQHGHTPHPQHGALHGHPMGMNPAAYDSRFSVQSFQVDPAMMFKADDVENEGQLQNQGALYAHGPQGAGRGGLGHGSGYGS